MANNNWKRAGKIVGNPLCGLCERVCLSVRQIYDGCAYRERNFPYDLTLNDFSDSGVYPFTYERLRSNGATVISNLTVSETTTEKFRIRCNTIVPVTVYFSDANSKSITAQGSITLNREVFLRIPTGYEQNYSIEIATNISSRTGVFTSPNTINVLLCIAQITRVVVPVDLLLPTYGRAVYPDCSQSRIIDECDGIEDPIF